MVKHFKLIFYFLVTFTYLTGFAIDDVLYDEKKYWKMGFAFDESFGGRRIKLLEYLNMVILIYIRLLAMYF
jgi:hypothetical protein